jgi:hypothetical protein
MHFLCTGALMASERVIAMIIAPEMNANTEIHDHDLLLCTLKQADDAIIAATIGSH